MFFKKINLLLFLLLFVMVNSSSFATTTASLVSNLDFGKVQPNTPTIFKVRMRGTTANPTIMSGDISLSGSPTLGVVRVITDSGKKITFRTDTYMQMSLNGEVVALSVTSRKTGNARDQLDIYIGGITESYVQSLPPGIYTGSINVYYKDRTENNEHIIPITASIEIGEIPISINVTDPNINMGTITLDENAGTIVSVSVWGNATVDSGIATLSGATSAASIEILGQPNETVYFLKNPVNLINGSGDTISVTPIFPDSAVLSSWDGNFISGIGATLDMPANTKSGIYTGTITIDVNY